ncbi:tRNA glutamyl-Q(34) synthetase GluQRS [Planktotalea sp.]|uniref:tRNA glutamyl-Q(34) synthetase GluQRS n=1 Tax=Planktotalea sp. TaxID=2029877 RepID=UPI003299317E
MTFRTRFAPSPTGPLHLGHAYSAILAHDQARAKGGAFFLRLDDIDQSRARPHWAQQIERDLNWLGLSWDGPIWSQHARSEQYDIALTKLWDMGLLYPCACSRKDIKEAANAPQESAPLIGPDGLVYPGTCRRDVTDEKPADIALRLNMRKALQSLELKQISFSEKGSLVSKTASSMIGEIGDVVLARKDMAASYHLSIVVDDAEQGITDVMRGEDLQDASFIHVLLQQLLGYDTPKYHHHSLIRDTQGKRLAKRDDSRAIAKYREDGLTPQDIRAMVGL